MEQGAFTMVMVMLIIFVFVPAFYLRTLNSNRKIINDSIYLAARSLEDCVEENELGLEQIALGYQYSEDPIMRINIDEAKLLTDFEDVLFKSLGNAKKFNKVQRNIACKILVYPDRYVVIDDTTYAYLRNNTTGEYQFAQEGYSTSTEVQRYLTGKKEENILAPKYFTYSNGDDIIPLKKGTNPEKYYYINTLNDKVKDVTSNQKDWRTDETITQLKGKITFNQEDEKANLGDGTLKSITSYDKNQAIINILNSDIMHYTNGVKVKFENPYNTYSKNKNTNKVQFNIFEGITFLIVYKEDSVLSLRNQLYKFNQYNVVGYTLKN